MNRCQWQLALVLALPVVGLAASCGAGPSPADTMKQAKLELQFDLTAEGIAGYCQAVKAAEDAIATGSVAPAQGLMIRARAEASVRARAAQVVRFAQRHPGVSIGDKTMREAVEREAASACPEVAPTLRAAAQALP